MTIFAYIHLSQIQNRVHFHKFKVLRQFSCINLKILKQIMIPVYNSKGDFIKTIPLASSSHIPSYSRLQSILKPLELQKQTSTSTPSSYIALQQNEVYTQKKINITVQTPTGLKYIMVRHPFTPIQTIKQSVQTRINSHTIELWCKGRLLSNPYQNLASLDLDKNDIIYAFDRTKLPSQEDQYQIIACSGSFETHNIKIRGNQKLGWLKQVLAKKFNIPDINLRVSYHGQFLSNDSKPISEFYILPGTRIQVVDERNNNQKQPMRKEVHRLSQKDSYNQPARNFKLHKTQSFEFVEQK